MESTTSSLSINRKVITHLIYIISYFVVTWAVFLLTSSFITFFHLQLDHTLAVVENWNQDQGWEIASFVKLISFFILIKFVSIRSTSRRPLRDFFVNRFQVPNKRLFTLIVFVIFFCILFFKPVLANRVSFEFSKLVSSYIGSFIYISCDVIFLLFVQSIYPMNKKSNILLNSFFITVFYYLNTKLFSHSDYSSFSYFFYMIISIRVSYWKSLNWSYLFITLILCICPLISFLGIDFIWGNDYSYLIANSNPANFIFLVLVVVTLGYIHLSESKILERITKA